MGNAVSLDGVDDYVSLASGESDFDAITTNVTVEAWFRVEAFDTPWQTIISKGDNSFRISRANETNFLHVGMGTYFLDGSIDVNDGNWHHVSVTWSSNMLSMYVDGVLDVSSPLFGNFTPNNFEARIGSNAQQAGREFNGEIDNVRIYDGATLIGKYDFDDDTATDLSGQGNDGVLVGGPTFEPTLPAPFIGYVELSLSAAVDISPGIIVNYQLTGSTATVQQDFYTSQLDLNTTDMNLPTNSVFIAEGEDSARIYVSALPDAVDEDDEDIVITLLADVSSPFGMAPTYNLTGTTSATIAIRDGQTHTAGVAITNTFGENVIFDHPVVNAAGEARFWVHLTSEPTDPVTINLSAINGTPTSSLNFTTANWSTPQEVLVTGLAGEVVDNGAVDVIDTVTLSFVSSDGDYTSAKTVFIDDFDNTVKVKVDEDGTVQTILPTASIRAINDATEGDTRPGVFNVTLDRAAPAEGLRVLYSLVDDTQLGSGYDIVDSGLLGNSLSLDGVDEYVDLAAGESTFDTITSTMTIETWIKVDQFDKQWQTILAKGDNSWRLARNSFTNTLNFAIGGSAIAGSTDVNDGEWHHVAATYDGSVMILYVDGQIDVSVPIAITIPVNDFSVQIGENSQQTGRYFDGLMDEVRIWDTARTEQQILASMNRALTGMEDNLVAYYDFEEASGTTVPDLSSNSIDGTLVNGDGANFVPADIRSVVIQPGETSATIIVLPIDDQVADGDIVVDIDLVADASYQLNTDDVALQSAQLTVFDNDVAGVDTVTFTNIGSLDTTVDLDVDVDDLFLFGVSEFTETATGAEVTVSVHLNEAPAGDVVLTLTDANSAANDQLTFTTMNYGDNQSLDLTLVRAADGTLALVGTTDANGDANYNSLNIDMPFRQIAVSINAGTLLATTEGGDDFIFGVRLTSEPTVATTIDLLSSDASEGVLSTSLMFDSTDWNVYQRVMVVVQDDIFRDGEQSYEIAIDGSAGDANYLTVSDSITITNQDDEESLDVGVDTNNVSDIIVTLNPLVSDGDEDGTPAQFRIELSSAAPSGGLTVGYVVFAGSATRQDLALDAFIQQFGGKNPLAVSHIEATEDVTFPASISFGDLDNDGDLDALLSLIGNVDNVTRYLENVGTAELPQFVENTTDNPLAGFTGQASALADVDGDGDVDVIQVNSGVTDITYLENQLIETAGTLGFIERVGMDNPFAGLGLSLSGAVPALVDIDDDGDLEVFLGLNNGTITHLEYVAGDYVVAGSNPFTGIDVGNAAAPTFADWDFDGDQDAFIADVNAISYYENVGSAALPMFELRTGPLNPFAGYSGFAVQAAIVDINANGALDAFVTNGEFIGEVQVAIEYRYFEAARFQEVVVPEGETSLVVDIDAIDDDIDEAIEMFEVALVSRLSQSHDVRAVEVLDREFGVVVEDAYDGMVVGLKLDASTSDTFRGMFLAAGTPLTFSGGTVATVTDDVFIERLGLIGGTHVPVTLDVGTMIELGETGTGSFDTELTILVTNDLTAGSVGLMIAYSENLRSLLLSAGTVLTFDGGTVVTVDQDTLIDGYTSTQVPVTPTMGTEVTLGESTNVDIDPGELKLVVDELDTPFLGLATGIQLDFGGVVFEVGDPKLLSNRHVGDGNLDGAIDGLDYLLWAVNFGDNPADDPPGPPLNGDYNEDGRVDGLDYLTWAFNFGQGMDNAAAVWGTIVSGVTIPDNATATIVTPGYRTTANLKVTAAFAGGNVTLQIDEMTFGSFTLPAGLVLEFDGGAIATVDTDTSINNMSGTAVPVTISASSPTSNILGDEVSSTAEFFSGVGLITTDTGVSDGFVPVQITDPGTPTFLLKEGTLLTFSGGAVVSVSYDQMVSNSVMTYIEVIPDPDSPLGVDEILAGETTFVEDFAAVSSVELTINDNDVAGVTLTPSGLTTSEAGASQTIDVVLDSQPLATVFVYLGVNGNEALLSDVVDETDVNVVQLVFTPTDWDVTQTVTVTGVDDLIDDGNTPYKIITTLDSTDDTYTDDAVPIVLTLDQDTGVSEGRYMIDSLSISETVIPDQTLLTFTNGSQVATHMERTLNNVAPETIVFFTAWSSPDTISLNHTAVVADGDARTNIVVTSDLAAGSIGLQIDGADTNVTAVTLAAGKTLTFDNGAKVTLNADVTLSNTSGTSASVTLVEGVAITTSETSFFEENLIVTTAYDGGTMMIGLEVDDPLIKSVTLATATNLHFDNGVVAALDSGTAFTNDTESLVAITIDTSVIKAGSLTHYQEQLVADLMFTNIDDDGAGITAFQTDPILAITEGLANNFFSVVLDTEPTADVVITLTPSDDNIRLENEFIGEPISITFDSTNWNIAQTVNVSAVDDTLLEYDHSSTIVFSASSDDTVYDAVAVPSPVEVFITDDELPSASVQTVAGAIEANAPGYFVITLDTPPPSGYGDTGIVVHYSVTGTADSNMMGETDDVQPITGTALIAPGETTSQLIAFPIDDFKAEGIELDVVGDYDSTMDSQIDLAINVKPFLVGAGTYNGGNMTVELSLDSMESTETTILSTGTVLIFSSGDTARVTQSVIVAQSFVTDVPIEFITADAGDIVNGQSVHQQVELPAGTELKFAGGAVVRIETTTNVTNESGSTSVDATLIAGGTLMVSGAAAQTDTALQGESVTVTLDASPTGEYSVGAADSASLTILDNDKPGIRVAEIGTTTVIEGEASTEFFISLLSQPAADVDIDLTNLMTTRTLTLAASYLISDTVIGVKVNAAAAVDSMLLPMGSYDFDGTMVTVGADVTIFSAVFTAVGVSLDGALDMADTHDYMYAELSFENGSNMLTFTADNWYALQTVTIKGVDDSVVEKGDFHTTDISFAVTSIDPNYSGFEVPVQTTNVIDRRFDKQNTYRSLNEGFLALQDSINSLTLPIIGELGDVAPSFIGMFLGDLAAEIRATDNINAQGLTDAFNTAIAGAIGIDQFTFEVTGVSATDMSFLLAFTSDSLSESVTLDSDFGLEALNISIESMGTVDLNVDFAVSLGFGISAADGFYFNTDETFFDVSAGLTLSEDFSATGELGFLQLDITNAIDVMGGDTEGTGVTASIVVTLEDVNDTSGDDTQLTLAEIAAARDSNDPFSFITYGFAGGAALDLNIVTSVSGNTSFPSFSFNLFSELPLFNYGNEDDAGADEAATLTVDTGFSNKMAGDVVMLELTATGITSSARLAKGTELTFDGDRVIVNKTVTIAPDGTEMVEVKIAAGQAGLISIAASEMTSLASSAFNLAFNDITLDLGGFVTDLISPIISSVNDVIAPFRPIIDVLTSEVSLLSSIGIQGLFDQDGDGEASLLEVALTLAGGLKNGDTAAKVAKFINAVTTVIELTDSLAALEASIASGGSLAIDFGSYELQGFKGASASEDAAMVDPGGPGGLATNAMDQAMSSGNNRVGNLFSKLGDIGISIDVIENPLNVIKLFLGQNIDLVTWDVPELDLNFKIEQQFPVFAGIKGILRGEFSVHSDLVFGFDTVGLSQWKDAGFGFDKSYLIFDGFYLSDVDPDTGEDVDELTLEATIAAGVSASAVIASIEATGGITGTARLDLIDVGEYNGTSDGRIRGSEIISRISRPLELFEIAGQVDAFLNIAVKIGIDLGFWSIEKTVFEKELARVTLFEFSIGGGGGGSSATTTTVIAAATAGVSMDGKEIPMQSFGVAESEDPYVLDAPTASNGNHVVTTEAFAAVPVAASESKQLSGVSITPVTTLVASSYQFGLPRAEASLPKDNGRGTNQTSDNSWSAAMMVDGTVSRSSRNGASHNGGPLGGGFQSFTHYNGIADRTAALDQVFSASTSARGDRYRLDQQWTGPQLVTSNEVIDLMIGGETVSDAGDSDDQRGHNLFFSDEREGYANDLWMDYLLGRVSLSAQNRPAKGAWEK